MPESIKQRMRAVPSDVTARELFALYNAILVDLAAIRTLLNTHVHGGVTVGAGNTGVPTTTAAALQTQA